MQSHVNRPVWEDMNQMNSEDMSEVPLWGSRRNASESNGWIPFPPEILSSLKDRHCHWREGEVDEVMRVHICTNFLETICPSSS